MTPAEHYVRAERLLAKGVEVVQEIKAAGQMFDDSMPLPAPVNADDIIRQRRDDLGKQVTGIWAQALVHAQLAQTPERTYGEVMDINSGRGRR